MLSCKRSGHSPNWEYCSAFWGPPVLAVLFLLWYNKEMIILQFIFWYFFEVPKKILEAWRNLLKFNLEYFSILLLFKTFFSHWRRYKWAYPRGFSPAKYFEVFLSNLISRVLGMIMRTILISIGVLGEILIFFMGTIVLLGWFVLPVLLWQGLRHGLKFIFYY